MNNAGRAAAPWSYPAGVAVSAAAGYSSSFVADMIADYYSTDDLFELVWDQQGGGGGGASGSTTTMQPAAAASCRHWSPAAAEVRFDPPSEDKMASWLCAIVKGEELIAFNDDDGGGRQQTAAAKGSSDDTSTMTDTKEKLPISEGTSTKQEMRKPGAGGSSRRSRHGEAHSLTEKRRRHKINERLRTLQQLVPGCDNSNQTSTLDKTIQYMKSLQHQVHVMSAGSSQPQPAAAAAYPFVPPQYVPSPGAPVGVPMPTAAMVLGASPAMVPFGAMLQLPQYPLMMPAAPASLYPAAAPPPTTMAPAAVPGGAGSSASRRQAGSSSRKGKGSSSRDLRQKHY